MQSPISQAPPAVAMAETNDASATGELIDLFSNVFKKALMAAQLAGKDSQSDEDAKATKQAQDPIVCLPVARKVDFEHFKNRFHEGNEVCAVEALVASSSLAHDVHREKQKRSGVDLSWMRVTESGDEFVLRQGGWIQMVRINSQGVLGFLAKAAGEVWALEQPRTFLRPFRVLIFFQDKVKEALNDLEEQWANAPMPETAEDIVDVATAAVAQDSPEANKKSDDISLQSPDETPERKKKALGQGHANINAYIEGLRTLKEMRCYVDFVDKEIMPLADMFKSTSKQEVRFEELWLLFKVGETIYGPPGERIVRRHVDSPYGSFTETEHLFVHQEVWRVYGVTTPVDQAKNYSSIGGSKPQQSVELDEDEGIKDPETFSVDCYYIDYDGSSYQPVPKKFSIRPFKGERSVTSLPCYPVRYAEKRESLLEDQKEQGRLFQEFLETKHVNHSGWTMVNNPSGSRIEDHHRERKMPEFVDGPVIIDFKEAFSTFPSWKPHFRDPNILADNWTVYDDEFPIRRWSGYDRAKLISETTETVQDLDGVSMWQRKQAIEGDEFLIAGKVHQKEDHREKRFVKLRDEDLVFLPKRVFAFALRDRNHVMVDVRSLRHIEPHPNVFERLKIHKTKKEAIRSLVSSHFEKKELEEKMDSNSGGSLGQDFIHGKGDGLVILLHGVPGVGKTATAEAVALERRRPLFPVTCGDIGVDAGGVDVKLKRIFRLANRWGCVLLFDEADVFLAQRSTYDMERNALVSVFLRALEYYHGILFLTTNRVGLFDEAFTSRIHLMLHYPELDERQTVEIFKTNIQKLRDTDAKRSVVANMPLLRIDEQRILEFARAQYAMGQQGKAINQVNTSWNGRQIRNAFQVASSLAYRRVALELAKLQETNPDARPPTPVLDDTHFNTVADTTMAFNEYLRETKGWSDADLAHMRGYRADYYVPAAPSRPRYGDSRDWRDHATADDPKPFRYGPNQNQPHGGYPHGSDNNSTRLGPEVPHANPYADTYMANAKQSANFTGGGGGYRPGVFGSSHQQPGGLALGADPQARGGMYGPLDPRQASQFGDGFERPYAPNPLGNSGSSRYPAQHQTPYGHTTEGYVPEEDKDDEYT